MGAGGAGGAGGHGRATGSEARGRAEDVPPAACWGPYQNRVIRAHKANGTKSLVDDRQSILPRPPGGNPDHVCRLGSLQHFSIRLSVHNLAYLGGIVAWLGTGPQVDDGVLGLPQILPIFF